MSSTSHVTEDQRSQLAESGYTVLDQVLDHDVVARVLEEIEPHFGLNGWGRNDLRGPANRACVCHVGEVPVGRCSRRAPRRPRTARRPPQALTGACRLSGHTHPPVRDRTNLPLRRRPPRRRPAPTAMERERHVGLVALHSCKRLNPFRAGKPSLGLPATTDRTRDDLGRLAPGSALVWLGGIYHGGRSNTSDEVRTGVSIIYFQPWLRQVENMVLVVRTRQGGSVQPHNAAPSRLWRDRRQFLWDTLMAAIQSN